MEKDEHKKIEEKDEHKKMEQKDEHKKIEEKDEHKKMEQKDEHKKIEKDYNNKKKLEKDEHKKIEEMASAFQSCSTSYSCCYLFPSQKLIFWPTEIVFYWSCLLRVIIYFSCSLSNTFS